MNIFNLNRKEIEKTMKETLKETTPEELLNDLVECGYESNTTARKDISYER